MNLSTDIMSVDTESRIFLYILKISNEPSSSILNEVNQSRLVMLGSAGLTVKTPKHLSNTVRP